MSANTVADIITTRNVPTYEVVVGAFDRPFEVIYLTTAHNVSYALACVEAMAMADRLLGKRGFNTPDTSISYSRTLMPWDFVG